MRHNFRELKIWKLAINLSRNIYEITNKLPAKERFGLIDQMNRSSVSVASNIAEGSGRTTPKEFSRFLDFSISSSYELETQLVISSQIYKLDIQKLTNDINELQKMIRGFQRTLV